MTCDFLLMIVSSCSPDIFWIWAFLRWKYWALRYRWIDKQAGSYFVWLHLGLFALTWQRRSDILYKESWTGAEGAGVLSDIYETFLLSKYLCV